MAERLTEKHDNGSYTGKGNELWDILTKLGRLEDIMEKYGIDIQNLDYILEDYSKNQGRDFAICEERDILRQDRDAWKRACELACKNMKLPVDILIGNKEFNECHSIVEYFYQQAKKEENDE